MCHTAQGKGPLPGFGPVWDRPLRMEATYPCMGADAQCASPRRKMGVICGRGDPDPFCRGATFPPDRGNRPQRPAHPGHAVGADPRSARLNQTPLGRRDAAPYAQIIVHPVGVAPCGRPPRNTPTNKHPAVQWGLRDAFVYHVIYFPARSTSMSSRVSAPSKGLSRRLTVSTALSRSSS